MRRILQPLAWISLGGALGVGASVGVREATRTPLARQALDVPPPPPVPPAPPDPEPEPAPAPAAPAAAPPLPDPTSAVPAVAPAPTYDYFGFAVDSEQAAAAPPPPPPPPPPAPPPAPKVLRYVPMKDRCVAGFDATSTLHDFRGWTKAVGGFIRFEEGRLEETAEAVFTVDARTLDTNNPDRDKEMHEDYLHTARHPEMKLALRTFRPRDGGAFTMTGVLEIHGKTRPVEIPGTFELRRDGHLHAKGGLRLKMSDFGIDPPVTALVIRVDDEIRVWFEIWARREDTP